MIYCKHCSGKLYEEEVWFDENNVKHQQIGCYQCYKKVQVEYQEWLSFKRKLNNALIRSKKNAKSKT